MQRALAPILLVLLLAGCASDVLLHASDTRARAALAEGCPLHRETEGRPHEHLGLTNPMGARIGALLFSEEGDHGTLMVSGGNAMGRYDTARYTRFVHGHGFRVVTFSFQGYDDNAGHPDLGSLLGDARTVHAEIARRFPDEPIAYLASSISTAPALCMPSQAPDLAGVVLEAQINLHTLSFQKMGQWWWRWALPILPMAIPYSTFFSLSVPGELRASRCARDAGDVPALFLHHERDVLTSYGSARRLYDSYAGPKHLEHFQSSLKPSYHLLLPHDPPARARVVETVKGWLARSEGS